MRAAAQIRQRRINRALDRAFYARQEADRHKRRYGKPSPVLEAEHHRLDQRARALIEQKPVGRGHTA